MKNSINLLIPISLLLSTLAIAISCSSSREVTSYSELSDAGFSGDPIRVLTEDSQYYTLNTFSYSDSMISGTGTHRVGNEEETFQGSLEFSEIVFIERLKKNGWKGLWLIPVASSIVGGVFSLMQPPTFEITRPDGSCPFLYAYDGTGYRLEAEAFSTAISKALESRTFHLLPSLKPAEGELRVRIANERPETHLFNEIKLYAVDAPAESEVVLDTRNRAWALHHPYQPAGAYDMYGKDITEELHRKDNRLWKTDRKPVASRQGYRDTLLVHFSNPELSESAILRVDAINSTLINEIYSMAGVLVGDETLGFYHTLEEDSVLQNYFRSWIQRSSLLVEVQNGSEWEEAGRILPEANEVIFSRALFLENLDTTGGQLSLRISSMADVWHLDAITVDFAPTGPLAMKTVPLISLQGTGSADDEYLQKAISESDSLYAMTLPPDQIDLTFNASVADDMAHPNYVMAAKGYLYEWLPETEEISHEIIPEWLLDLNHRDMLALLTQNEDLLIEALYNHRAEIKAE